MEPLQPGLYESLLTEQLRQAISAMAGRAKLDILDKAEAPALLAQFLQLKIQQALENEDGDDHLEKRLQIANGLLEALGRLSPETGSDKVADLSKSLIGVLGLGQNTLPVAPQSPLVLSSLFTGSAQRPQLSNELLAEMQSADQVDILISFIKNSGLRLLRRGFDDLRNRNIKVRIITTTYMGASDAEAIEELAKYPNVEIKVSFDTEHTRLHAKAYYFKRLSGFTTAYVGSSNMSNPAMSEGLEWNLKATQKDLPQIIKAFEAEFDAYWNSDNFQPYVAGLDAPKLRASLATARGTKDEGPGLVLFDIYPRPFQERILEALRAERENRGNYRNLIVAATGTGKTVISAFDYKRFAEKLGRPAKLLFLAHREEIVRKSQQTFRQVMKDGDFGSLMGGSAGEPESLDFLFCTVQTANSRRLWERLGKDFYDFIIVDEAHYSSADTYKDLIMGFSPKVLLGMTATPERMDGDSILPFFGGKITTELRLPEALEEKLLCPFQYFCVADPISLSDDSFWDNGNYSIAALEKAYAENAATANQRLDTIFAALDRYTMGALGGIKGLGFCASVKHAEFMAKAFTAKGLPSLALSANTDTTTRNGAIQRLQQGELKFIFAVDLFNEGVDIPAVNLVLFLRPTDSLTVYLQQLGRGLRHSKGKECLLVLDFVAQMHKRYRIDRKFAALLPGRRYNIQKEVEASFPHVPPGCSIQLEKQAMELVLANIKAAYANIRTYVVETMRTFEQEYPGKALTFGNYVDTYDIEPHRILDVMPWYQWKALAKGEPVVEEPDGKALQLAAERIGQASGPDYLKAIRRLPEAGIELSGRDPAYSHMLHSLLWQKPGHKIGADTLEQAFGKLRNNPRSLGDLVEVANYRLEITNARAGFIYPGLPLELYGHYGNDEIQAAFGRDLFKESAQRGVGVLHFPWCKSYALLITLQKSEKDFSPTTMYKDRLMSPNLLHWESQSNTSQASETGQNLIRHAERGYGIYIFVRDQKRIGTTTLPFQFLGRATYVSHEKEKPIEFVWKLDHPIPGELLEGKVG